MEDNAYKSESMHDGIPKKTLLEAVVDFFKKDLVQYIVKRILMFIPTLLLLSVLVFFVIQLPPGDYVSAHIAALASEGEFVDADYAASLRADYGLDLPIHEQYFKWMVKS